MEKRLAALETEVAELKKQIGGGKDVRPWWQQIAGAFRGDKGFLEAMKLGREYRESLRPKPKANKRKPKNGRA
jgi:hypothetical protein